jgi:glycosyltransferase involved in cell wall biosynthesis
VVLITYRSVSEYGQEFIEIGIVSIVIFTYNEELLKERQEQKLALRNYELIVVSDGRSKISNPFETNNTIRVHVRGFCHTPNRGKMLYAV